MKKRPSLIILISTLTLLNGGCGSPSENQAPPSLSPSMSPNTTAPPPIPSPPSPQAAASPSPKASPSNPKVIGLIPSTNPTRRRQEILSGRTNPFALIGINVLVKPDTLPSTSPSGESGKAGTSGKNGTPIVPTPFGTNPTSGTPIISPPSGRHSTVSSYPVGKYCKFEGKIGGKIIEIQPKEAQGILVSGIVKLPTGTYAIVTPRNSKVAQSVRQGTLLGNALVRVAAIDPVNETVVFEENGKFVYREIGQRPVTPKTGNFELKGEIFPFKIKPPIGKQAYGAIVKGKKALMLTQASILLVNVAGEDKPGGLKQLANPPWTRNPTPNAPAPGDVPAPTQPIGPQATPSTNQPGGTGTQGTNPPASPNPPNGTAPVSQASAPQKSTRLSGTICNDSSNRITVSRIKIQIQDAETNTVLDTQWSNVASTNVVLDRGQSAKFDVPIPRLQDSSSDTIAVRLLDWQGE